MISRILFVGFVAVLLASHAGSQPPGSGGDDPLLHWNFDQSESGIVQDLSANQLDATRTAELVQLANGNAIRMDGTPGRILSVTLPPKQRLGTESWTFMAMIRPEQFEIDDKQNQRRIFSFGKYPTANLILDIQGNGQPVSYFCYKDAENKTVSLSCSSGITLSKDAWQHLAFVCDRENRTLRFYVNGYSFRSNAIPVDFEGDFSIEGELTIGSNWHNYWGLVDEVKLFRSALGRETIEAEFERLKDLYHIVESAEIAEAKNRDRLSRSFDQVNQAWERRDFQEVRSLCESIVSVKDAPSHFRSYAHLRMAQSFIAEEDRLSAIAAFEVISADTTYPQVHRDEASQSARELNRINQGLPARDPRASRTMVKTIQQFSTEFFVSVDGDDQNPGTRKQPFATVTRARDGIRRLKKTGTHGPIAVTLLPGSHQVRETIALTDEDSGTQDAMIVYRAEQPGTAILYGGTRLSEFKRVTDKVVLDRVPSEAHGKVWQCDLKANGITDFGRLVVRGFGQPPAGPTLELFINGRPMTLSRWPNQGFVGIKELLQPGSKAERIPSIIRYQSDRHQRWLNAKDAWLFGYFHFLWADATIKVAKIDPASKTLTTAEPYHYGGRGMSAEQGIQYYAFNLLEEIDAPEEWYLDRDTGILYVIPPEGLQKATAEIGLLSSPMITMKGVSHVRIEGIQFDLARYNGVILTGCQDCSLIGCTLSRFAGNGVVIHGGQRNQLIGCDIHTIGRRASEVIGGDRATLTPGRHVVENCRIYDFGRIDRTYTPAIQLEGVGNRVAHNLMYRGPSSAMRIEGNDHLIEWNKVHSMVQESDDQGAMEMFGNPTYRGVVFRHNLFHQVGKTGTEKSVHGQAAIRFDDAISGMLVYGNVFYRSANGRFGAIQLNSGRDNVIDNNLFIDCKHGISGGWYSGNHVWKSIAAGTNRFLYHQTPLYRQRYPEMATMMDDPGINRIWRNIFYRCGDVATRPRYLELFENGVFDDKSALVVNEEEGDYRFRSNANVLHTVGFKPIPLGEIGLYESPTRASWPVKTVPVKLPDWR